MNVNERMWAFRSSGGELSLIARTDNDGSGNSAMTIIRDGTTITDVNFGSTFQVDHAASTVSINGNDIQSQITENLDDNASQDTAIGLNTDKVGFTNALVAAAPTVTANTIKLSYTAAASTQVATNVSDINTLLGAINSNADDITSNASLISTHETRHDGHDTAIATKLNTSGHQTMNGRLTVQYDGGNGVVANPHADDLQVYHYNDGGITIGCPEGKIGTVAFSDQNKADRNQIRAYSTVRDTRNIGMHFLANQAETAVPTLSVTTLLVGINNAQPTYTLDVTGDARITGSSVFLTGLPSSDPGVAGQLYVKADGLLRVSSG